MSGGKLDGFISGGNVLIAPTAEDSVVQTIEVQLRVTYPAGTDLKAYKRQVESLMVQLIPGAYLELERRSQ